jgi:probable F420-dependent oxidoreductase
MRFGFHLPHFGPQTDRDQIVAVARKAEALGFDSLWALDHIIMPEAHVSTFTANVYEPFTVLSFLAGCTEKIKLGTSVIIVPYRNPIEVAKIISTLDVLSNGRVIFGAGVGWMEEEFEMLGVPFRQRGARIDEYLQLMKELWTGESPKFQGRFYRVSQAKFEPKPVQKPHPPIWIGGATPAALRRVVAWGDGWHPVGFSPEQIQAGVDDIKRLAEDSGRDVSTIEISARLRLSFTEDAVAQQRNGLVGTPDAIIDRIKQYEQRGVSTILLDASFSFAPKDEMLVMMERFSNEVLAQFRR